MPLDYKDYIPTHAGAVGTIKIGSLRVPEDDGLYARCPANFIAECANWYTSAKMNNIYTAAEWTVTTGGTGDAQAQATTAGGGVLITAASDDNFDTTLDSVCPIVLASGKRFACFASIRVSDADGIGFYVGFTTGGGAAALPFGTEYTDVVGIRKAIASADVYGRARGNGGTAASTSSALGTMADATEITVGFFGMAHATTPELSFYYNGTVTGASADQLTQLAAILTTPPTMYTTLHATGVTATNPTMTVRGLFAGVES